MRILKVSYVLSGGVKLAPIEGQVIYKACEEPITSLPPGLVCLLDMQIDLEPFDFLPHFVARLLHLQGAPRHFEG